MSDDTRTDRPEKEHPSKRRKTDYQYTSFDLDMISCAKNHHVVDFFFVAPMKLAIEGEEVDSLSATILIVDKYFLKVASPDSEGKQREVWIAKSMLAGAEPHKTR